MAGEHWKRKGRMMTKNQFYGSNLHFKTEAPYSVYKKVYKGRYKKTKKRK